MKVKQFVILVKYIWKWGGFGYCNE